MGSDYKLKETSGGRVFLSIDVQSYGLWFVVREWHPGGTSRLIDFGSAVSLSSMDEIMAKYAIASGDVIMDSGFDTQTVYTEIAKRDGKWKASKGHDSVNGYMVNGVRKPFMWSKADAMLGQGQKRTINLLVFSNPMLKDALAHLMSGKGPAWEFSREAGEIYLAQVTAERREERVDAHGRVSHVWKQIRKDNHLFDCEVLQTLAALATKILGGTVDETEKSDG